ncbi:hypothetical protein BD779DRAFT_1679285 [Infundibulicybe gibba]|nr:hypothetical protein BD779DRAFT_1679285 [Infundibulicybe gibba]
MNEFTVGMEFLGVIMAKICKFSDGGDVGGVRQKKEKNGKKPPNSPESKAATPQSNPTPPGDSIDHTREQLSAPEVQPAASNAVQEQIDALRQEVGELLALNKGFKAANEELKKWNEELMARNEELRSWNEELKTSNEALGKMVETLRGEAAWRVNEVNTAAATAVGVRVQDLTSVFRLAIASIQHHVVIRISTQQ